MTENKYGAGGSYAARGKRDKPYYYRPSNSPPDAVKQGKEPLKSKGRISGAAVISVSLVMIAVIGLILFGFFSSYFDLSSVEVSGSGIYTREELMAAGGIELGSKLYSIDAHKARELILSKYSDIADVEIKKHLPSAISIAVEFEVPKYYIRVTGEYFTLSENLKVLEKLKDKKSVEAMGLIYAEMPEIRRCVTGENVEFFDGEEVYIKKFLSELSASPFDGEIDRIYIKNKFDISIVKLDHYRIKLGDKNDSTLKLKMADKVLEAGSYREMSGVILDVSNVAESSVKVDKLLKIE